MYFLLDNYDYKLNKFMELLIQIGQIKANFEYDAVYNGRILLLNHFWRDFRDFGVED